MSCIFLGMCLCCVTEDFEDRRKPDKRKLRREKRQYARGMLIHMEVFGELGRKSIRKVRAIEKAMR